MVGVLGLRGCLHEKTRTGTSFILQWLFDFVSRLLNDQLISYLAIWRYTLHGEKIHVLFKVANITHALPVAVYRQTDFTLNVWLFPIEMILLWCFVPEWISHLGTSNRVNLPLRLLTWGDHGPMQMNWHLLVIINQLWYIKAPSCTSLKKIKNWMVNSKVHWYVSKVCVMVQTIMAFHEIESNIRWLKIWE